MEARREEALRNNRRLRMMFNRGEDMPQHPADEMLCRATALRHEAARLTELSFHLRRRLDLPPDHPRFAFTDRDYDHDEEYLFMTTPHGRRITVDEYAYYEDCRTPSSAEAFSRPATPTKALLTPEESNAAEVPSPTPEYQAWLLPGGQPPQHQSSVELPLSRWLLPAPPAAVTFGNVVGPASDTLETNATGSQSASTASRSSPGLPQPGRPPQDTDEVVV